jgi:hypothetical protein
MDREFNIYCYSDNSKDVYPNNRADNFFLHLTKPVHLTGDWECGLVQFEYTSSSDKPFFVCTDTVMESYVGDYKLPVLRRVRVRNTQFSHVIYAPVKTHDFNSIRIFMRTWKNKAATMVRGRTFCTLHFRRVT